jgi:hypothetical protein
MVNIWLWGEVLLNSNVIRLVIETYPSEKYEFVSWDDDIPNIYGTIKFMFQTPNQIITWVPHVMIFLH